MDECLQANMGHGVTYWLWVALFSFTNFSLLWCVWLSVWLWGCQPGFFGICFFNMPRLETLLGLFIWNVVMRLLFQDALYKQNKTRLIQDPLILQYVFIQKIKYRQNETKRDMAFNPLRENGMAPWAVYRGCDLPEVMMWGCRLALSDCNSNT